MKIKYGKKEVSLRDLNVKKCKGLCKAFGLMFRPRGTRSLIFEFRKKTRQGIHSFFVFFDFVAVFLDEGNTVLEAVKVRPFRIYTPKEYYSKLLEIPVNRKNSSSIKLLVGD